VTDRLFRLIFGLTLLVALYFKLKIVVLVLVGLLVFEAATNRWILKILGQFSHGGFGPKDMSIRTPEPKYGFEAEQGLRLLMASVIALGVVYYEMAWFLPWLVGFALVAAGISGICPVFLFLKYCRLK
jgi:Inner membrane protein YgaP-like, transmembrane domain